MPLTDFTLPTARPLPVLFLIDGSGSMSENGKMDAVNTAMRDLLQSLATDDARHAEVQVAAIVFSHRDATLHLPFTPVRDAQWSPVTPFKQTPMAEALRLARELLEDQELIPSRAYRPTVVLVSDGVPNEPELYHAELQRFLTSPRASKAFRLAMGIGADVDTEALQLFLHQPGARVFQAHEARHIHKFFQFVSMSVTARSKSLNPNEQAVGDDDLFNDLDLY